MAVTISLICRCARRIFSFSFAFITAGKISAASTAMMAMTTSISTSVNAFGGLFISSSVCNSQGQWNKADVKKHVCNPAQSMFTPEQGDQNANSDGDIRHKEGFAFDFALVASTYDPW